MTKVQKPPCTDCVLFPRSKPCPVCGVVISAKQRVALFKKIIGDASTMEDARRQFRRHLHAQRQVKQFVARQEQRRQEVSYVPVRGKCTADVAHLRPRPGARKANKKLTDPKMSPEAVFAEVVLQATSDVRLIQELQQIYAPKTWDYLTANPGSMMDGLIYDQRVHCLMSCSRQYRQNNENVAPVDRDLMYIPTNNATKSTTAINRVVELMYKEAHWQSVHGSIADTLTFFRQRFWSKKGRKLALNARKYGPTCIRLDSQLYDAPQAPLPEFRYTVGIVP